MADAPRRRVLLVTRNFPPVHGGMERLNLHMALQLAQRHEVHVIAPVGARAALPESVAVTEVALRPLWRFVAGAAWHAVRVAHRWKPDAVIAGSGLTAPIAWLASVNSRAASLAYVHGLDIVVPNLAYRTVWRRALRRMTRVVANSGPTAALAVEAGVSPARIAIIHPGVETARPSATVETRAFRHRFGLGSGPILLSVGRLTRRKGLVEFIRDMLPVLARRHPGITLVVIGNAPVHALHGEGDTPEELMAIARSANVDAHLRCLGNVDDATLEAAFEAAALHVFPVRIIAGDPEGFGMVAIEAAARGVPTVAFASGGIIDAVNDGVSGALVRPGDADGMIDAIERMLSHPLPKGPIRAFAERFDWTQFGQHLAAQVDAACRDHLDHA